MFWDEKKKETKNETQFSNNHWIQFDLAHTIEFYCWSLGVNNKIALVFCIHLVVSPIFLFYSREK